MKFLSQIFFSTTLLLIFSACNSTAIAAEPEIRTIGPDAECDFPDPATAALAMPYQGNQYWKVMQSVYENQVINLQDRSVVMEGGFVSCHESARILILPRTVLSGTGNEAVPESVLGVLSAFSRPSITVKRMDITRGTFSGMRITSGGLGIDVLLDDVHFTFNKAEDGGAIFVEGEQTALTLHNVRLGNARPEPGELVFLTPNIASNRGGGLWCDGAQVTATGLLEVNDNEGVFHAGGFGITHGCQMTAERISVFRNKSTIGGGGITASVGANLRVQSNGKSTIEGNTSDYGGGIGASTGSRIHLSGVDFIENVANLGAAIGAQDHLTTVIIDAGEPNQLGIEMRGNTGAAAAVISETGAHVDLRRVRVSQNQGSPIFSVQNGALSHTSVIVAKNISKDPAEPLYDALDGFVNILNSTIVDNQSFDAVFDFSDVGSLELEHSIVYEPETAVFKSMHFVEGYCNNLSSIHPDLRFTHSDLPLFMNEKEGDYRLAPESMNIDRCANTIKYDPEEPDTHDFEGRLLGIDLPSLDNLDGPFDVGAFEADFMNTAPSQLVFSNSFED